MRTFKVRRPRTTSPARRRLAGARAALRTASVAAALVVLGSLSSGCSTHDPARLEEGLGLETLSAEVPAVAGHRVLLAPIVLPAEAPPPAEEGALRAPMRVDPLALQDELVAALERVLGAGEDDEDGPRVAVAITDDPAREAWEKGYDLVLQPRVTRWDAVFLGTNGWWYPNALFLGWYLWPIGSLWIADEEYGVDLELAFDVLSVASERPLPGLADRRVLVRTPLEPDELARGTLLPAPRLALNDLERGMDFFGTWTPGDLDPDQWEQVGAVLAPYARRHAAVETAAAVGESLARFRALSPDQREEVEAAIHAVVIGISAYPQECVAAADDAELVRDLLVGGVAPIGSGAGLADDAGERVVDDGTLPSGAVASGRSRSLPRVPAKNVHLLLNGQASASDVLEAVNKVAQRARPQDALLIYFAGRGAREPGAGLESLSLLAYGARGGEPLTLATLAEAIRSVPCERRLIALDVDFVAGPRGPLAGKDNEAAGPGAGAEGGSGELATTLRGLLAGATRGGVVLASEPGTRSAAQVYRDQGLLTRYLVRGLGGEADEGGDGLTYADLESYLERRVRNLSEIALPSPQRPLVVSVSPRDRVP